MTASYFGITKRCNQPRSQTPVRIRPAGQKRETVTSFPGHPQISLWTRLKISCFSNRHTNQLWLASNKYSVPHVGMWCIKMSSKWELIMKIGHHILSQSDGHTKLERKLAWIYAKEQWKAKKVDSKWRKCLIEKTKKVMLLLEYHSSAKKKN